MKGIFWSKVWENPPLSRAKILAKYETLKDGDIVRALTLTHGDYKCYIPVRYKLIGVPDLKNAREEFFRAVIFDYLDKALPDDLVQELL